MQYIAETSRRLDAQIAAIDLPEELAREAEGEYRRIARWLGDPASALGDHNLSLYPQGSFRLGTPIRPIIHHDEFDIDLVCRLDIRKEHTTQADLKKLVGDRLKEDRDGSGILEERRRCWTLFYRKKFHLDVLPTIPDAAHHSETGILVTDTQLRHWQFSNPIGYANWFYSQMQVILTEERSTLAKARHVDIEQIPMWSIRTPLQRSVQLLKRHRDIHFQKDFERRPVSVIITTLAGRSYQNEADLAAALLQIIEGMEDHVENRDGKWWVSNPAHEKENFADKWNEKPALREAFLRWRDRVHEDIDALAHAANQRDADLLLEKSLHARSSQQRLVAPVLVDAIPDIDSLSHRQTPPWPVMDLYSCAVSQRVTLGSGAGRSRFRTVPRAPKGTSITFYARTDTPPPYEIYWQVTNTGAEARAAKDLRGEIRRGTGERGETRTETTKYNGTHLVQAFVVKDGVAVARSSEVRVRIERK